MLSTFAFFLSFLGLVLAIPTISIKGTKFYTSDGQQFFVKGVAYQLVPADPLVDGTQCGLDAALMKTLGANAIRVYHVDPTANHEPCMTAFANAGIYVFVDLDTFDTQINPEAPTWNKSQFERFQAVMDSFHSFDNLAGFFVGNEVLTQPKNSPAAPFVKAATHDIKSYRNSKGYRTIPVGYSAADIASLRPMLQNYLACGPDLNSTIDFFALNAYEWCGENTYQTSGYAGLTANVTSYNVPIFFSETGCITARPRTFTDQAAILGPDMTPYWSGAMIYEWIEEANNYGLISYGAKVDPSSPNAPPDGYPRSGTPNPIDPDFPNLKAQWAQAKPSSTAQSAYAPTISTIACPASTSGVWDVDPNAQLPTLIGAHAANPTSTATGSGNGNGTSSSSKSAAPPPTSITATAAAISASVQTTTIAIGLALGTRSALPMVLLGAFCVFTLGNVMLL